MNKFSIITAFTIGVIAGAIPSWYLTKKKYLEINERDIESVKESLGFMRKKSQGENSEKQSRPDDTEIHEYSKFVRDIGYTKETKVEEKPKFDKPHPITPDEFYENNEYERLTFFIFRDDILVDDDYQIVHDVNDVIGYDSLEHIGEYEDDVVYVRNDKYKTDYEVCRDERTYEEFLEENPYKRED